MILFAACGDDDSPSTSDAGTSGKGGDKGAGTGGTGASSGQFGGGTGAGGAGGMLGGGTKKEGLRCMSTAECAAGLACTQMGIGETLVPICARPCTTNAQCMSGESCESPFTQLERDAHCLNFVAEPFAPCGIGDTSACGGNRVCVYDEFTVGICVNFCTTDPSVDAGIPGVTTMCPDASHTCIEGLLSEEELGICGTEVQSGGECGLEGLGKLCVPGNLCVADDLDAESGPAHCREDCSDTAMCRGGGTCTAANSTISYCKK